MANISAILVDDESNNLDYLSSLLESYCSGINVIARTTSPLTAIQLIRERKPDLIFLDIMMPEMDGFQLLDKLENKSFEVIFVTAFDRYALQAIKVCALDYLLKPIEVSELKVAVGKAMTRLENKVRNNQLDHLIKNLYDVKHPEKLGLPNGDRVDFIAIGDILYCRGEINYTHFFLKSGMKRTICKTLKEFESMLDPFNFIRIHQSYLVNLSHVVSYVRSDGGFFIMSDGKKVSISRHRRNVVTDKLKRFALKNK